MMTQLTSCVGGATPPSPSFHMLTGSPQPDSCTWPINWLPRRQILVRMWKRSKVTSGRDTPTPTHTTSAEPNNSSRTKATLKLWPALAHTEETAQRQLDTPMNQNLLEAPQFFFTLLWYGQFSSGQLPITYFTLCTFLHVWLLGPRLLWIVSGKADSCSKSMFISEIIILYVYTSVEGPVLMLLH